VAVAILEGGTIHLAFERCSTRGRRSRHGWRASPGSPTAWSPVALASATSRLEVARALDAAVFVAHNARFDWRFLRSECVAVGAPAPAASRSAPSASPAVWCRSCATAGSDHVAAFFGVDNPARHRAFGDALATARVLRALLERAREREVETLEQLVELHDRPRHKQDKVRNAECGMRSIEGASIGERPLTAIPHSALRIPHSPNDAYHFQSRTSDLHASRAVPSGSTAAPCSASCRNPCGSAHPRR